MKKIFDVTGIELTPGQPEICEGAKSETCCCDECDYLMKCFPRDVSENALSVGLTYDLEQGKKNLQAALKEIKK